MIQAEWSACKLKCYYYSVWAVNFAVLSKLSSSRNILFRSVTMHLCAELLAGPASWALGVWLCLWDIGKVNLYMPRGLQQLGSGNSFLSLTTHHKWYSCWYPQGCLFSPLFSPKSCAGYSKHRKSCCPYFLETRTQRVLKLLVFSSCCSSVFWLQLKTAVACVV